jgi:uncharacterized RDD family membrane protein YckC
LGDKKPTEIPMRYGIGNLRYPNILVAIDTKFQLDGTEMTSSTTFPLAFRCNKCWQLTCADSDQVGHSVPCICCSTPLVVPEITNDAIKAGEEFTKSAESKSAVQIDFDNKLTDKQIYELAREKVRQETLESGSLMALVSSRWKRLIGAMIDSFAFVVSCILGFIVLMVLGADGGIPVMIAAMTVPLMLAIVQLYMTAVEGRTVGKYCVKSKIVRLDGSPPGFFQGIVLRIIAIGFLGFIPLFGLLNACWIFQNDENRCIHDYLAGTLVIDA